MFNKKISFVFFVSMIVFTSLCFISSWLLSPQVSERSSKVSDQMEEAFLQDIAAGVEVNKDILMVEMQKLQVPEHTDNANPSGIIGFIVLNQSVEAVEFVDRSFGLEIFTIDEDTSSWRKIEYIKVKPERLILPPRLLEFDGNLFNAYSVLDRNVMHLQARFVRFYISGVGQETGKLYGAYLDTVFSP